MNSGTAIFDAKALLAGGGALGFYALRYDPTLGAANYTTLTQLSSAIPMTWTAGDMMRVHARYPMTTRYS